MKKALIIFLKGLLFAVGGLLGLILLIILFVSVKERLAANRTLKKCQPLETVEVKTLTVDGFRFRDLNKNGQLALVVGFRFAYNSEPAAGVEKEDMWLRLGLRFNF